MTSLGTLMTTQSDTTGPEPTPAAVLTAGSRSASQSSPTKQITDAAFWLTDDGFDQALASCDRKYASAAAELLPDTHSNDIPPVTWQIIMIAMNMFANKPKDTYEHLECRYTSDSS